MEPLLILFLVPLAVGVAAVCVFHDARHASIAATLGCALVIYVSLQWLDPGGTYTGLAAFLVLPLPLALALGAVIIGHGRSQSRRRHHHRDA